MTIGLPVAAAWLVLVNALAFVVFGLDKRRARHDRQRLSESFLLNVAFFGGSVGAKLGQRHYRHKTRKQPFARQLNVIIGFQIAAAIAYILWRQI